MEGDAPDVYARDSRRQVFAHWDAPFVAWLEQRGYEVSYCTDFDLHYDETLLADDALVLSAGHDEYWSARCGGASWSSWTAAATSASSPGTWPASRWSSPHPATGCSARR